MKQYITEKQLNELTDKTVMYRTFAKDKEHGYCLSIGQMIEFLYQHTTVTIESEEYSGPRYGWFVNRDYMSTELCDALWQAVKAILKTL